MHQLPKPFLDAIEALKAKGIQHPKMGREYIFVGDHIMVSCAVVPTMLNSAGRVFPSGNLEPSVTAKPKTQDEALVRTCHVVRYKHPSLFGQIEFIPTTDAQAEQILAAAARVDAYIGEKLPEMQRALAEISARQQRILEYEGLRAELDHVLKNKLVCELLRLQAAGILNRQELGGLLNAVKEIREITSKLSALDVAPQEAASAPAPTPR